MGECNWESEINESTVSARLPDRCLHLPLYGCSDNGQFCLISPRINHNRISYREGRLNAHDIILEIQGYKVSGYTQNDLEELIQSLTMNCEPILIKTILNNRLPPTLKEYLSQSFTPNSFDQDLQRVIRDNVYLRVVPCTTRNPRSGEINGVDYQFLTIDEFLELDKADGLLESGMFDGNYYGTPKPTNQCQRIVNAGSVEDNPSLPSSTDLDDWDLGVLPDHWEMAFTEDNYRYFIDHNTGTTQWNDPRLPEEIREYQVSNLEDLNLEETLPYGWEKVFDTKYGVFYIDHNNKRTQYEPPDAAAYKVNNHSLERASNLGSCSNMGLSTIKFTNDPSKLNGSLVRTTLIKSPRGFGFTIIGGSDRSNPEFLQIKHVMPGGPAAVDGHLETGDVLVYVDNCLVLGFLHADIVGLFQKLLVGQQVTLTVCKGYSLPYDINDPRAHVVTTMAVGNSSVSIQNLSDHTNDLATISATPEGSSSSAKSSLSAGGSNTDITTANAKFFAKNVQPEFIKINIVKSSTGFGFTISDNIRGQRVMQILDQSRCGRLKEGDVLVEINKTRIKERSHQEVVQILKDCVEGVEVALLVQRGGVSAHSSSSSGYSSFTRLQLPITSLAPPLLPPKITGNMPVVLDSETMTSSNNYQVPTVTTHVLSQSLLQSHDVVDKRGLSEFAVATYLLQQSTEDITQPYQSSNITQKNRSRTPGPDNSNRKSFFRDSNMSVYNQDFNYNEPYSNDYNSVPRRPKTPTAAEMRTSCYWDPESGQTPDFVPASVLLSTSGFNVVDSNRRQFEPQDNILPLYGSLSRHQRVRNLMPSNNKTTSQNDYNDSIPQVFFTTLHKQINGFGFRIIGGAEDNTKITIGPLVPDGAAIRSGQIKQDDELVSVNGAGVVGASHKKVVQLVAAASSLGSVTLGLRRPNKFTSSFHRRGIFDVTLTRSDTEGFGFVIVTSMTRSGSHMGEYIGKLIENSPAQRCGLLRVDDRILAVNGLSVSKMRHEKIVQMIKNCGHTVTLSINPVNEDRHPCGTSSVGSHDCSDQGSSQRSSKSSRQKSDISTSTEDFEINLIKGLNGFGFSIKGGQDFNKIPLFVLRVADDGPAKLDGRLKVGDKIMQINGKSTAGMTHSQAISIIQAGGNTVKLLARRSLGGLPLSTQQESALLHSKSDSHYGSNSPSRRPVIPPHYVGQALNGKKCS